MRYYATLFAVIALLLLPACSSEWWSGGEEPPATAITVPLEIKANTLIAQIGETVALTAQPSDTNVAITEYRWTFSDGRSLSGKDVSVSFPADGVINVKLEASSQGTPVGNAETQLSVVAVGALAPAAYGFPAVLGDLNGDRTLELDDTLLAAQAAKGLVPLEAEQINNADMDRDGRVDDDDIALMQKAVLRSEPLPRALFDSSARPGAVLAMVSPDLLPTGSSVEIRVDGVASPQVLRIVRGYASFIVPKTDLKHGAPAAVELVVAGSVRDRFTLTILDPAPLPTDRIADVSKFMGEIEAGMGAQQDALRAQITDMALSDDDREALLAASAAGLKEFRAAREELVTLMSGEQGDRVASQFQQALYANGLAEFRSGVDVAATGQRALGQGAAAGVPDRLCDVVLPSLCALKRSSELLDTGAGVVSGACSVAAASVFLVGVGAGLDGPAIEGAALAAFVNVCVRFSVAIEVSAVVGDLVTPIEPGLRLTADKTTLAQAESAILRTEITFVGYQNLCGLGLTRGGEALINKVLGEKIVYRLMRNNAALNIMARVFSRIGGTAYNAFLGYLRDGVSNALSGSQLTGALGNFATGLCGTIQGGFAQAVAANILQPPAADEGILQFLPNGTAQYSCPPPGPVFKSRIDIVGTKELCGGKIARANVGITCATSPVTITMGDNGAALDDIYEVLVGGRTVLTSSTPTRSVSVTIQLPKGRTDVIMRGLAAPDGIGTYFISFAGAAVVGGDALTGTDLVPGATKRFTIEVF